VKPTMSKQAWKLQRGSEATVARRKVREVESLFRLADSSDEPALNEGDYEALGVAVRIMTECDFAFRRIPNRTRITRSVELEYLCDTIQSGMDSFETIKGLARLVRGIRFKRPKTSDISLEQIIAEHLDLFERLGSPKLSFAKRLSVLVDAIQLELVFFGIMWW
jgi:hypothetical protein